MKEQIEDVRRQAWHPEEFSSFEGSFSLQNQKTNNISILGVRGTGKTSILKTFRRKLEEIGVLKGESAYN